MQIRRRPAIIPRPAAAREILIKRQSLRNLPAGRLPERRHPSVPRAISTFEWLAWGFLLCLLRAARVFIFSGGFRVVAEGFGEMLAFYDCAE